ncbi:MAG: hypothetical protein AVDCRST_MAG88-2712 [uncultured Thermomicrobiales bacterium]|uniref:Uncharacterized protein n=1 Tax=uncultured Thermomicrobiales bacterium TaxID=1645740 RepID=A0A6J4VBR6_9BACT|nr:MAG: hypothetical protein AVDCRST_MAG88-2712 [uncultured Thermomicrobiales bacterium]
MSANSPDGSLPGDGAPPFDKDDHRGAAAAFSQLSGVLGGFCITIVVLVLDESFLQAHGTEKNWAITLLLLAGVIYIASSGILANSMNSPVFIRRLMRRGRSLDGLFALQREVFGNGIALFLVGNVLLAAALTVILFQYSVFLGVIAVIGLLVTALAFGLSAAFQG